MFISSFIYASDLFYKLNVDIVPDKNYIYVDGIIKFYKKVENTSFYLNKNIWIDKTNLSFRITKSSDSYNIDYFIYDKKNLGFKYFSFSYLANFKYSFEGNDNYAKGIKTNRGIISKDGCFLSELSAWYPVFDNKTIQFDITVKIPRDYDVVLPGKHKDEWFDGNFRFVRYISEKPVFELPLVCGKYKKYYDKGNPDLYVYMLKPDDELASKYMKLSRLYIEMYEKLIGKYPYEKFAVVENFWETGYAFPSFTLLGSSVMRFPFIFVTSLPHEILHNWWGNGVYVDYTNGNWSEGLTTYLSDYLFSEQRGKGVDYRMNVLKKYTDYISDDIPLKEFKERHSNQTEALGYGKSMMFFHMLRKQVGDDVFIKGLKNFYLNNLYKKASWDNVREAFEKISKKDMKDFFDKFINRKYNLEAYIVKDSFEITESSISFKILNNSSFTTQLPLIFYYSDMSYDNILVDIKPGLANYSFNIKKKPLSVCLDCEFDFLRRLVNGETAITFSKLNSMKNISLISEYDLENLIFEVNKDTSNADVIIFAGKRYLSSIPFNDYVGIYNDNLVIDGKIYNITEYLPVFIIPIENKFAVYIICENNCEKILNKLVHYTKYSYLIFDANLDLIESGVWSLKDKENTIVLSTDYLRLNSKNKSLIEYTSYFKKERLKKHVYYLSDKLKTRHLGSKEIEKAAKYIENEFGKLGLKPLFEDGYRQPFNAEINNQKHKLFNVCGKTNDDENYIVISAHYDHLFPQNDVLYPGANDNASGVSLLIELARYFVSDNKKGLIFCAFSGEEYGKIGSDFFVKSESPSIKIIANINLDTVGRIYDSDLIIINHESSKLWNQILRRASMLSGIGFKLASESITSGDQISFIKNHIPAIQIYDGSTDDYHKPTDISQKIDFEKMLWVADFTKELIYEVKRRGDIPFLQSYSHISNKSKKKITLGFAPDFNYSGIGVKIKKINENSILKEYGIEDGDIIVSIDNNEIKNIFDYMDVLSNINPDIPISIEFISGNNKRKVNIILKK